MRRGYSHLFPLILILLLFSTLSYGQAWSGILDPARAIDWTQAGIPGGIPSGTWANCVTTACNTAFSTPTAANINSALSSAPNNTVVRVPAGTISGAIHAGRSNVVLRGAGPTQTFFTGTVLMGIGTSGQGSPPSGQGSTSLSTLTKGSTVLTIGSSASLSAGQVVVVDQLNDTSIVNVSGAEGSENAGRCAGPGYGFSCNSRGQLEMVQIQSVDSSTQITIKAPGLSRNLASGLSPQIFYWSGSTSYDGVENLTVNASSDFDVSFIFCHFCWTKNIAVISSAIRGSIYFMWAYRGEARDSYVQQSNASGAPTQYGIECDTCSFAKIENNIIFGVTAPLMLETSYGVVTAYNYVLNTATGAQYSGITSHRSHESFDLVEGNVGANLSWDDIWGGGSQHTSFRNRFSGYDVNHDSYRIATQVSSWHRYTNIIANVLGDPTFHTRYESKSGSCTDDTVYQLAIANNCGNQGTVDATTYSSLTRWGNWDAVTYCTNGGHSGTACGSTGSNGIRYCTGSGAGNAACTASETASTDPTFPGLASPSTTFPASFYNGVTAAHASCGTGLSFWKNPSSGYCPAYPPIGPDVTCSTNCITNTASHAAMIPAQLCYNKTAKTNGFLTAFDASACYANDPSSDPGPTGLKTSVH